MRLNRRTANVHSVVIMHYSGDASSMPVPLEASRRTSSIVDNHVPFLSPVHAGDVWAST